MWKIRRAVREWKVFTDGSILPDRSGLAAVVFDERGMVALWWYRAAGPMTCNEAEYAAAIFALEQLLPYRPLRLDLFSDSQVMVRQMRGEAAVRAAPLRQPHARLAELATAYAHVCFHHVARTGNRLADALSKEAAAGPARAGSHAGADGWDAVATGFGVWPALRPPAQKGGRR